MEQGFLTQHLHEVNKGIIERIAKEGPKPPFRQAFNSAVDKWVVLNGNNLPVNKQTEQKTVTGPVGVNPPPAKRINAIEELQGLDPTPLRKRTEEVVVAAEKRVMNPLSLHIVAEITPKTVAAQREIQTAVEALTMAGERVAVSGYTVSLPDSAQPPITVAHTKAMLHLITQNAVGGYEYKELSIHDRAGAQEAIAAYQQGLQEVLQFKPGLMPSNDLIAHDALIEKISDAVKKEKDNGAFAPLVVVNPRKISSPNSSTYIDDAIDIGVPYIYIDINDVRLRERTAHREWKKL